MLDADASLYRAFEDLDQRRLTSAIAAFDSAERGGACADRSAAGRWTAHMLMGNMAAAWRESDAIFARGAPDVNRFWCGEDLRGKRVIVRCLHGYGDTVQFLRYLPSLQKLAGHVVLEVPPVMLEIARCFEGVDLVSTWHKKAEPREWDAQIEIMELPYLFRTEPADLPVRERYLRLPAITTDEAARSMRSAHLPRVGIVWAGGEWNQARSVPIEKLQPLLEQPGCEFWNLQGGTAWPEWYRCSQRSSLQDAPRCRRGILPLAETLAAMDLLITVDTLAAHLAGAMGEPAWVMLQHAADWRWMTDRADSPWYPSLRLFRQNQQGEWGSVVRDLVIALDKWRRDRSHPVVAA